MNATDPIIPNSPPDLRIVVLPRGWVLVGRYAECAGTVTLTDAAVIRRWGTTLGLGEIAAGGPTENTVLDRCPPVTCAAAAVILTMTCDHTKWRG